MIPDTKSEIFLRHILESLQLIERYTQGLSKIEFLESTEKQDAIIRRIEIVGEAVKNLPRELRSAHPNVEWDQIAGTRDILVHRYFGIDLDLTWEIVERDLPNLRNQIQDILSRSR